MVTVAMKLKDAYSFGRKVMTNLDSIFKSRDITLPTKVRLVKAVVFPVVMYGCESWTVKKAEHRRKHKVESRLPGEVSTTSDMQMIPLKWQKMKRN